MQSGAFPQLQNEFNANLEILKVTKDPAKRHELLINLRRLLATIESLAQDNPPRESVGGPLPSS